MVKRAGIGCLVACGMALAVVGHAQDKGTWRAQSTTAKSITGDIAFFPDRVSINFVRFIIAQIRTLEPAEATAAFDLDPGTTGAGNLYRLSIPSTMKFLHKNSICGSEETEWMITYTTGRDLHIAFFSGQKIPTLTPEAFSGTNDLCGTFSYTR